MLKLKLENMKTKLVTFVAVAAVAAVVTVAPAVAKIWSARAWADSQAASTPPPPRKSPHTPSPCAAFHQHWPAGLLAPGWGMA